MAINVELLRKVQAAILAEPEHFDMDQWCGTTCCIAGHTVALSGGSNDGYWGEIRNLAQELLGLDMPQGASLFYVEDWPDESVDEFFAASSRIEAASAGSRRIDAFIKQYAPEAQ